MRLLDCFTCQTMSADLIMLNLFNYLYYIIHYRMMQNICCFGKKKLRDKK